ncbi:acetyl-CoA acetyltransferase [Sphingomonas sp.]|jgi:acetyl-CoA C-acetyltransferase|uniref:acetyl-CoA acetyltransferase n=1 Tax=Sphingomonas sp. TaxID=28214 RepID=UPI002DEAC4F7|nr:acetyl-CoA acetyltransferase [Sphingomonas sp.]
MNTPVLIGVGQTVYRGEPRKAPELSPVGLAAEAARRALADAGLTPEQAGIDRIAAVRMTADNRPPGRHPFGAASNFPRAVANRIGAAPRIAIYGVIGGQSPQAFVNECAEALHAGACEMALIVAAEATGLERAATRAGIELDWHEEVEGQLDDRGPGDIAIHPLEVRHGLYVPVIVYSLIEHAQRARLGRSRTAHLKAMAELFAGFSKVAAANPYSQFPLERSAGFLSTVSADNYPVSDPYPKWLVAQDAVNQGAAVLMTTDARADALGVPREKRVYLHGYATLADLPLIERPDLGRSRAAGLAAAAAFDMARARAEQVGPMDIYSCFPCAVVAACEALGIPADYGERLTVTGGLPYFGGPGNAYSLFAIAALAERLRAAPGELGLISANGGFMSKESVGLYSTNRPRKWRPLQASELEARITAERVLVDPTPDGLAAIESFTISYAKGQPVGAAIIARTEAGARTAAAALPGSPEFGALLTGEPIGRRIRVESGAKANAFRFSD